MLSLTCADPNVRRAGGRHRWTCGWLCIFGVEPSGRGGLEASRMGVIHSENTRTEAIANVDVDGGCGFVVGTDVCDSSEADTVVGAYSGACASC